MKEKESDELEVIAEVASMYYEHDIPQNVIAEKMFFSRAKVSRLLKKAREQGIVEIIIRFPLERVVTLERTLCEVFGLKDAVVIKNYPENNNANTRLSRLGKIAGEYLDEKLKDGDTIGLAWGRTLYQMVSQIKPKSSRDIHVVQLTGAAADGYNAQMDSPFLVRKLAEKYRGTYSQIYAPLFVENNIVKQSLVREVIIAKALQEARSVDYLVTGIADFHSGDNVNSWAGYLDQARKQRLIQKGAVGFICGHFLDQNGNKIFDDVENNLIGVSLDDLKKAKNVIAVSGGVDKAHATYAALKGNYIHCLITDEFIAEKILRLHEQDKK